MFLKYAIKEYEFDCKARKLGVNTIQGYMRMLRYLMDYLDKEYDITQIEDVKPFHIKHFLLLKQEEGLKCIEDDFECFYLNKDSKYLTDMNAKLEDANCLIPGTYGYYLSKA